MLFLVLVTSTKHYWVVSAERRRRAVIFVDFSKAQHQELSRIHASQVEMSFFIRSAKLIRVRPPKLCRIEFALEIDFTYRVTTQGTLAQTGLR